MMKNICIIPPGDILKFPSFLSSASDHIQLHIVTAWTAASHWYSSMDTPDEKPGPGPDLTLWIPDQFTCCLFMFTCSFTAGAKTWFQEEFGRPGGGLSVSLEEILAHCLKGDEVGSR